MKKRVISVLFYLVFMLTFVSCSTTMTTPPFAITSENAWFLEQDASTLHARPFYCMADIKDGKARPKCYRSETITR